MTRLTIMTLALALTAALTVAGCSPSETAERAEAKLEKAGETASETLEKAGKTAGETLEKAGQTAEQKLTRAGETAQEKLEQAGNTAQEKLEQAGKAAEEKLAQAGQAAQESLEQAGEAAENALQSAKPDVTMTRKEAAAHLAEGGNKEGEPAPAGAGTGARDAAIVANGDKKFRPGKDYVLLSPAKRTSSPPEKVELTEVFMYQCPHCFSFEPFIDRVMADKPPQVNLVLVPAIFNPVAKLHAQAFYASKSMGVWEQLHTPLFQEIHGNRNLMRTENKLLDFIASQGVDRDKFKAALNSFEVDSKVRDALDLNAAYRIQSVPTLVVNGKYVTSGTMAGSEKRLHEIVDYLLAKETAAL